MGFYGRQWNALGLAPSSTGKGRKTAVSIYFWLIGSIAACRRGGLQERNSHVDALPLLIRGRDEEPQTRLGAAFA
jgi:hypothetical protein